MRKSLTLSILSRHQALVEILLLSGGTPYANFKDLAYAWGREKGFHYLLATSICERRGEVDRKKRSDAGRTMTDEQRKLFRDKLKRARVPDRDLDSDGETKDHSMDEMVDGDDPDGDEDQDGVCV